VEDVQQETGIPVRVLPLNRLINPLQDLKALWATYRYLKKLKPDIVHTHTPKAGLIGMLAAKLAAVPVRMHTVAGLPVMEAKGLKRRILRMTEKLTSWAATGVYPNSVALRDYMIQEKLALKGQLKVLAHGSSNGINLSHFDPNGYKEAARQRIRAQWGISAEDLVFTFVGRLVGDKGVNELVASIQHLSVRVPQLSLSDLQDSKVAECSGDEGAGKYRSHHSIKLLLIGEEEPELDPLRPETRKAIQENTHIMTTGWQEDVRPFLAISDVFVFPSYREGMPNGVLQAGAMGLPQIVTDINGSNEIITHDYNGYIIPVKDTQALKEAMQTFLEDVALRKRLASQARNSIATRFDQKLVWEALLAEYEHLTP
jgi:glycosyltransferase involved in cell wall biosynthesis